MKYRHRNEIIAQILESANGNRVRLTKIIYDVYLSHTLTKEYPLTTRLQNREEGISFVKFKTSVK